MRNIQMLSFHVHALLGLREGDIRRYIQDIG